MKNLLAIIGKLHNASVFVIGDIMLDVYVYGDIEKISSEAPAPILKIGKKKEILGGAGNVVRNLYSLGSKVNFMGLVGNDENGEKVRILLNQIPDLSYYVEEIDTIPTTVKTRYISHSQQVLRTDEEQFFEMPEHVEDKLIKRTAAALNSCNIVVISDYNKGIISSRLCKAIINTAITKGIPVLVDPKGKDYSKYKGATLIKPNRKELSEFLGSIDVNNSEELYSRELLKQTASKYCLVTLGSDGMLLTTNDSATRFNATRKEVYDVCGAGDTVIATLAAAHGAGLSIEEAVVLSNITAGIVIGKAGTAAVTMEELLIELESNKKNFSTDSLLNLVDIWKKNNLSVGFTNGCFDLIHSGHISMLQFCKQYCDKLIVGLNSDRTIKILKGASRPINDENQRALVLSEFSSVDAVVIFDQITPEFLINVIKPDFLIKGGDYSKDDIVGASLVESYGGKVLVSPFIQGYSSTKIVNTIEHSLQKIRDLS